MQFYLFKIWFYHFKIQFYILKLQIHLYKMQFYHFKMKFYPFKCNFIFSRCNFKQISWPGCQSLPRQWRARPYSCPCSQTPSPRAAWCPVMSATTISLWTKSLSTVDWRSDLHQRQLISLKSAANISLWISTGPYVMVDKNGLWQPCAALCLIVVLYLTATILVWFLTL